ncbi:MAG: hypothetical protein KBS59_08115 [Clostridiales bacterium]|nr:hypothetical protein [Clostridiales bacterium]
MCFNLPFFQTGSKPVDDALYQLVEKLNATEFGAYAVFKEAENAINADGGAAGNALNDSQKSNYKALRDLIVKTGDYAIAHNDTIVKNLSGSYVTQSDFGTYKLETNQRITANSTGIEQLFTYTEGINNDDGEYGTLSTKQYIKTGLLFYDGAVPKYGVGIGIIETNQTQGGEVIDRDTSKLLTMTADEIAFWQQAVKVAYIQSGAINFPNANITGGSIKIGGTAANPNFEVASDGTTKINGTAQSFIKFGYENGGSVQLDENGLQFRDEYSGGIDIAVSDEGEHIINLESHVEADNIKGYKGLYVGDQLIADKYENGVKVAPQLLEVCSSKNSDFSNTYAQMSYYTGAHDEYGGVISLFALEDHSDPDSDIDELVRINTVNMSTGEAEASISLGGFDDDSNYGLWTMLKYDGERKVYADAVIMGGNRIADMNTFGETNITVDNLRWNSRMYYGNQKVTTAYIPSLRITVLTVAQ